ncbi:hypothetical protein DPMN_181011 [Dreissena polymorpha]|uniref:Uncharacterized protein n=1 Tax=Dreissena polymorpha TaxID=45954 RepID=A0A9D4DEF3_DREPO|nr:hypothetical protein DPMN_181011 [Dreissena polymorpha]
MQKLPLLLTSSKHRPVAIVYELSMAAVSSDNHHLTHITTQPSSSNRHNKITHPSSPSHCNHHPETISY